MGLLGLKEAGKAGPHAELPAAACKHSAAETVRGQSRHLRSKAALDKAVHSLIRVSALRGGQVPQPSPKQRLGEGRRRAEQPPAERARGVRALGAPPGSRPSPALGGRAAGGAGSHLRPAGSACRAPLAYRNRLRAAGWSPRTGNTSEAKPSSDTCSPNAPGRRNEEATTKYAPPPPPRPLEDPASPGTPRPHQEQSPRSQRPRGPNSSGPEFEDGAAGPSHGADPAPQALAALHQHHLRRGRHCGLWRRGRGSPAGGAHLGWLRTRGPGAPPRGALTLGAPGVRLRW